MTTTSFILLVLTLTILFNIGVFLFYKFKGENSNISKNELRKNRESNSDTSYIKKVEYYQHEIRIEEDDDELEIEQTYDENSTIITNQEPQFNANEVLDILNKVNDVNDNDDITENFENVTIGSIEESIENYSLKDYIADRYNPLEELDEDEFIDNDFDKLISNGTSLYDSNGNAKKISRKEIFDVTLQKIPPFKMDNGKNIIEIDNEPDFDDEPEFYN